MQTIKINSRSQEASRLVAEYNAALPLARGDSEKAERLASLLEQAHDALPASDARFANLRAFAARVRSFGGVK